jgi:hypothetical protein
MPACIRRGISLLHELGDWKKFPPPCHVYLDGVLTILLGKNWILLKCAQARLRPTFTINCILPSSISMSEGQKKRSVAANFPRGIPWQHGCRLPFCLALLSCIQVNIPTMKSEEIWKRPLRYTSIRNLLKQENRYRGLENVNA